MKSFAQVIGLRFGSAGAHTYPKSGQFAPPPLEYIPKLGTQEVLSGLLKISCMQKDLPS